MVVKYITVFASGENESAASDTFFSNFIGSEVSPLIFFLIFLFVTTFIVLSGVEKGIEKLSKFLMPVLLVLMIAIAVYILTIPGAFEGVKYYLLPDFSKFSFKTVCAAMGQMFYSMSLAMGIMITYGSYIKKDVNLVKSVNHIEFFDTLIALLSGLLMIPIVYVFSGEAGLTSSGPGLLFISLPKIFSEMTFGRGIGLIFFILVFLAAITSSVSVMEAIVSSLMDKFKLTRKVACLITIIISLALGIPSSLGFGLWSNITVLGMDFLTFFDYLSNSVLMPIVALFTCIIVGWIIGPKFISDEVQRNGEKFRREFIFKVVIKYIAPVLLVIILIFFSLAQFGIISY